jgi:hypothetical protein
MFLSHGPCNQHDTNTCQLYCSCLTWVVASSQWEVNFTAATC